MDKIAIVYLAYIWVGFLHSSFAGITLYSLWGHKIMHWPKTIPILILFTFLGLLEIYWIPIFGSLDLRVFTGNSALQTHFGLSEQTNIVETLRPNFIMVGMWVLQTAFAFWIGNWSRTRGHKKPVIEAITK